MEKRRVRIYKAGGEQGSYINKTQKYFQEGGIPQEQQAPAPTDEQIVMFIMQTLSQPNGSIEQAQQQLLQNNIDQIKIKELSAIALNYIEEQKANSQLSNKEEVLTEDNQLVEEEALAEEEASNQRQAQMQAMYNEDSSDQGDYDQAEADVLMRSGGPISKRKYMDTFMKLTKKAEGGKTDSTDIPLGGREERINNFLGSVKNEANTAALKQQAEEQYNQYMQHLQQPPIMQSYAQDGGIFPDQNIDSENPMHHIGAYATGIHDIFDSPQIGTNTELQFGGWGHGKERRAARRMNRMIPQGFNPMMQGNPFMQGNNPLSQFTQFMPNQGNLGLANIDVRRTSMFGRPKEYTINFNQPTYNSNRSEPVTQEIVKDDVAEKEVIPEVVVTADETAPVVAEEAVTKKTLPTVDEIEIVGSNKSKSKSSTNKTGSTPNKVNNTETVTETTEPPVKSTGVVQNIINNGHKLGLEAPDNEHPALKAINAAKRVGLYDNPVYDFTQGNRSPFQQGGFTDEESGLTRFTGGGEDFNQYDLDYSDSKNTISPYFQQGGLYKYQGTGNSQVDENCAPGYTNCFPQGDQNTAGAAGQTDNTVVDILDASGNVVRKGTLAEAERADLNHRVSPSTNTSNTNTTQNTNPQNFDYAQQYLQSIGMQINPFAFMPPNGITRGANWNKPVGRPYGTGTLNPISGMIGPNAQVSSINVDKIRRFGPNKGDAKKFTVNYNVPGQNGIHTSNSPKSYKGSDGQMHWMNNDNTNNVNPVSEQSWRDNRNDRRTEKVSKWFDEHGKDTWTNNNQSGQDNIFDENGMPTNDYAPGVIDNLRKSPVSSSQYRIDQADENQADRQAWDLERLRLQNRAYGGESLPKAQFGPTGEKPDVPFGYFKDPKTGVYKNMAGEIYSPKTNLQGNADKLMGNEFTQNGNGLNTNNSMGFDASGTGYRNEGLLSDKEKQDSATEQVSQKFKNEQEWNIDTKSTLDFGNMASNEVLGWVERGQQKKQNRNQGNIYNADQLYATTNEKNRGDWDQEGRFRLDQEGDNGLRMGKKGGSLQGEETWMSEEQIRQFLAEGGELEFI